LAEAVGAEVEGDGQYLLEDVRPLDEAGEVHLSFLDNASYRRIAGVTQAGAVLVRPAEKDLLPAACIKLLLDNPYAGYARAMQKFYPMQSPRPGMSSQAVVSETAEVDPSARLEPGVIVYAEAKIGPRTHIGAHTVVGQGVEIGADCFVGPNVTLLNLTMGDACLIHAGVAIGQDGFGFAQDQEGIIKVPQVGGVKIGNRVEIGANSTVDRGALGNTVIEEDCKLDCQVQIAHNVRLGRGCRLVAQVGIAGSTRLGEGVVIGGQSGVAGHIEIADRVMVAAKSGVTKSVGQVGAVIAGVPAQPIEQWRRQQALIARMGKAGKITKGVTEPRVTKTGKKGKKASGSKTEETS
jgi:UDP-3-O-[3-hydroxymyristoyl] glucosamine N-acyltransferase